MKDEKETKKEKVTEDHETLEEIAKDWLQDRKEWIKESTYAVYYKLVFRHIIPELGRMELADIGETVLIRYLKHKLTGGGLKHGEKMSWKTVSDIRSVLTMILKWGGSHGHPELSEMHLTMPVSEPSTMEVLTRKEQKKLEEVLLEEITPVKLGILLSLYEGLRIGEICGLQWKDINLKKGTIRVERTVIRIQDPEGNTDKKTKVIISSPKTANSIRTIPIPIDIRGILKSFRREGSTFLLTGSGKAMEPRTLYANYRRILKEADLPPFRYHTLRHSFASRCVEQDFDIKTLSEIMGHSSVKVTMDRYVHPTMDFKIKQMNRLHLTAGRGDQR